MSGLIESDPYGLRMSMMPLHKLPEEILEYIIDIVKNTWATTIQRVFRGYTSREGRLYTGVTRRTFGGLIRHRGTRLALQNHRFVSYAEGREAGLRAIWQNTPFAF